MPRTYNDVYMEMRHALKAEGIQAFALEALLMAAYAAGRSRETFLRDARLYCGEDFEKKAKALLERRIAGEPVAYITGAWEFMGMELEITPAVLIPRADTETLVEQTMETAKRRRYPAPIRILDLCAGSGCIGIALTAMLPGSKAILADISEGALHVCRANVVKNKLTGRVICMQADALRRPAVILGKFDMIVSNPPYVKTAELRGLDSSVIEYEPVTALDGGEDGLEFYRAITEYWKDALKPGGAMLFECGEGQADEIEKMLAATGFEDIKRSKDTLGIDRAIGAILKKTEE